MPLYSKFAAGVRSFLATPSSANLRTAMTDESGTGAALFAGGALGQPASGDLTNCTNKGVAGWSLLATLTTTSGSTQSATGLGTNKAYLIVLKGPSATATAKSLQIALSTNNGGAYNTAIALTSALGAAGSGWYGWFLIPGADDSNAKRIVGTYHEGSSGAPAANTVVNVMQEDAVSTAAVNAIQLSLSASGVFDAGAAYIYGLA